MQYRDERLAVQIRDELSAIILREMEFPGVLVTLTEVQLSKKRDAATVLVSVLPDEQAPKALKRLAGASGMLKHFLIRRLPIKVVPDLIFKQDRGLRNAAAVEAALLRARLPEEGADR